MTAFERWYLQRIIRFEVRQGHNNEERVTALFRMISQACEEEFYEDSQATIDANLIDWFVRAGEREPDALRVKLGMKGAR